MSETTDAQFAHTPHDRRSTPSWRRCWRRFGRPFLPSRKRRSHWSSKLWPRGFPAGACRPRLRRRRGG